jgi:hypothetical protein
LPWVLLLASGCATEYVFRPTSAAGPETGYMVARYGVPPEGPTGEIYLTSFGTTSLEVGPGASAEMLHVRLGMSNTVGRVPWTADAREQLVALPGQPPRGPTYANSDAGGPIITAPPGTQRVLDLYYLLPPNLQGSRVLTWFNVSWVAHTGPRMVAQRTSFALSEAPASAGPPPPAFVSVGLGWGPLWWYDPLWPYPLAVTGFRPVIVHYSAPPFVVGPGAHRFGGGGGGVWRGHPPGGGGWRGHPPR